MGKEEKTPLKGGVNKVVVLVTLVLGLSIVGYGYMNTSYKNKVVEYSLISRRHIL